MFTSFVPMEDPMILPRYDDGTGGCDGCLDWHGMGVRYQEKSIIIITNIIIFITVIIT